MRNKLRFEVPCEIELDTKSREVTLLVSAEDWDKFAVNSIEGLTEEELEYIKGSTLPFDGLNISLL